MEGSTTHLLLKAINSALAPLSILKRKQQLYICGIFVYLMVQIWNLLTIPITHRHMFGAAVILMSSVMSVLVVRWRLAPSLRFRHDVLLCVCARFATILR